MLPRAFRKHEWCDITVFIQITKGNKERRGWTLKIPYYLPFVFSFFCSFHRCLLNYAKPVANLLTVFCQARIQYQRWWIQESKWSVVSNVRQKLKRSLKSVGFFFQGSMHGQTHFHFDSSTGCWDISVWIFILRLSTNWGAVPKPLPRQLHSTSQFN